MTIVKDPQGNIVLPKWALWGLLSVGGVGSGGAAVTTFKVDAIARRLELHEVAGAPHTGQVRIEEMARITALVEGIRQEQMQRTDRIARVEAGQTSLLQRIETGETTLVRQLERIEKTLDELRRPR